MIPMLAAASNIKGDAVKKAGIIVGGAVVVGVGIYAYKKWKHKQDVQATTSKYGDGSKEGLAVQYASLLYSALHAGWFGATEDEKAIYATALKIHQNKIPLVIVSNAYRKMYKKELITELNRLLKPEELTTFNNALNGKYKPVKKPNILWSAAKATNPILSFF
jgi:hypothetical protein